MKILAAILAILILLSISVIHIYWAFGGKKWIDVVIPKIEGMNDKKTFQPGPFATLVVAFGVLLFAFIVFSKGFDYSFDFLPWVFDYGIFAIAGIFLLRGIGDFKYVGLFKKVKDTDFAHYDTRVFTPLSLILGGLVLVVALA